MFKTVCLSPFSFLLNLKYPAIIKYPPFKVGNCIHRIGEAKRQSQDGRAQFSPSPVVGNMILPLLQSLQIVSQQNTELFVYTLMHK